MARIQNRRILCNMGVQEMIAGTDGTHRPIALMTDRLLRSFSTLEKQTQRFLDELGTWTPEQLQFRLFSGSWSASDLIDHLVLTEWGVLATMRRNLLAAHKVTLRDRYRSAVVLGMMALPVREGSPFRGVSSAGSNSI